MNCESDRLAGRALVVIDVQNDFTEGGPLGAPGRDAVANAIGVYVASARLSYRLVLTTQDWHIEPGQHFMKHAVHCQADTKGAELDPELSAGAGRPFTELVDVFLRKGFYDEDLSGFLAVDELGRVMTDVLAEQGVVAIDVCGFVEDGCVAATVRDAVASGISVRVIANLCSASSPRSASQVEREFAEARVGVIKSSGAW